MFHRPTRHLPNPRQSRRRPRRNRKPFPLSVAGLTLALASCSSPPAPEIPTIPVIETTPVGDGLSTIGIALVGAAVVVVLGRLLS